MLKEIVAKWCGLDKDLKELRQRVEELSWDSAYGMWTRSAILQFCQVLPRSRRTVVVIDLNPLSRSSQRGSMTIVDELSRCLENMLEMNTEGLPPVESYDHHQTLQDALNAIVNGMKNRFSEVEE